MYGKIFASIFDSTLCGEGGWLPTYILMSMVAICDKEGCVDVASKPLYTKLGFTEEPPKDDEGEYIFTPGKPWVPFDDFELAILFLQKPDPDSKTPDEDGRRIIPATNTNRMDGNRGWWIVNADMYRTKGSSTERVRSHRKRNAMERDGTPCNAKSVSGTHTDTDTDTDKRKRIKKGETKACFTPDSPAFSLATLLHDQLTAESLLARKPDLQKWAGDVDRMLRIDKIPAADIEAVIEWLPTDPAKGTWPGWGYVIRSTKKLREKWEDLIVQYATATKSSSAKIPYKKCDQCKKPADVLVGDYDTPYCRLCRPNVFAAKYPEEK